MIIALHGDTGSGKDYFYNYVKDNTKNKNVYRFAFADKLKKIISASTGYSLEEIEILKRKDITLYNDLTMREIIENTALVINGEEDLYFTNELKPYLTSINYSQDDIVIITDFRKESEYNVLKYLDSTFIDIYNNTHVLNWDIKIKFDYKFFNDGTDNFNNIIKSVFND